MFMAIVN